MILTVFGYLILFLLAWWGFYIVILTASRAWYLGKAGVIKAPVVNPHNQVFQELAFDTYKNSDEILEILSEHTSKGKRILEVTEMLLGVTIELNQDLGELLKVELKKLEEFEDEPPISPSLVS